MKKKVDKIVVVVFMLIIYTPLIFNFIGVEIIENTENKKHSNLPEISFVNYEKATSFKRKLTGIYNDIVTYKYLFDEYYKNEFKLREELFYIYKKIQNNIFQVNPIPDKVVEGNNKWFFLGDDWSRVIKESKGLISFSKKELNAISENFIKKHNWFDKNGIEFYTLVVPNKHTIYDQFLPIVKSNSKTKSQQLKRIFENNRLRYIDLTDSFNQLKNEQLYYMADSHWTSLGALYGTKVLLDSLRINFPELDGLQIDEYDLVKGNEFRTDLTKMLVNLSSETELIMRKKERVSKQVPTVIDVPDYYLNIEQPFERRFKSCKNELKILVFGDSFSPLLVNFLKEYFGEIIFLWSHKLDKNIILNENPDIVVHEIVERDIDIFKFSNQN